MLVESLRHVDPAEITPPARSSSINEQQETIWDAYDSGGGGGGGGAIAVGGSARSDISNVTSTSVHTARIAAPTPTMRSPATPRFLDSPLPPALMSPYPLSSTWYSPPWRNRGSGGGSDGGRGREGTLKEEGTGTVKGAAGAAAGGSTYHCQICLDDRPTEEGFVLLSCAHTYCRACLKAYVTSKIKTSEVYPTCFQIVEEGREGEITWDKVVERALAPAESVVEGGAVRRGAEENFGRGGGGEESAFRGRRREQPNVCGVVVSPADIKDLLKDDQETAQKYARFLFFREHKTARECPRCSNLLVGDPSASLEMKCDECGTVFCYEHGGAHEGRSCAEYVESIADETQRSMMLIGRLTKPCPGCQAPVEKLGGCNQMVCLHCNCSFCWICMQEVDRGTFPVHFQWWNVRGCPNQQLQEESERSEGGRRCLRVLSVLQIIVVGPLALLLTLLSSVACVCCLPAFKLPPRQLFTGCISAWGNFVMVLPLLPVAIVGAVLAVVVYLLMVPSRILAAMSRKHCSSRTPPLPVHQGTGAVNGNTDVASSIDSGARGGGAGAGAGAETRSGGGDGIGSGEPRSLQSATNRDVGGVKTEVMGSTAATVVSTTSSLAPSGPLAGAVSTLATLAEVFTADRHGSLVPQVLLERREEELKQAEGGAGREQELEFELADRRLGLGPYPQTFSPPNSQKNDDGGRALEEGITLPRPSLLIGSPVSLPPSINPSRKPSFGSGSDGGDDETCGASSPLRARQMTGRWLGASLPLAVVSSPSSTTTGAAAAAAAAAAAVSSAGGVRKAGATAAGGNTPRGPCPCRDGTSISDGDETDERTLHDISKRSQRVPMSEVVL